LGLKISGIVGRIKIEFHKLRINSRFIDFRISISKASIRNMSNNKIPDQGRTPSPKRRHRTIFGNMSPNLINQSTNSIFTGKKLKSPDLKVVSSDWSSKHIPTSSESTLSSTNFQKLSQNINWERSGSNSTKGDAYRAFSLGSNLKSSNTTNRIYTHTKTFASRMKPRNKTGSKSRMSLDSHHLSFYFGSIDKEKCFGKDTRSELLNLSHHSHHRSHSEVFDTHSNGTSLRRSNTSEIFDRFIPSRHTTSGKLSLRKPKPKQSALPVDHIASQTSKIYQNTVAEACGLEVGERILQFRPAAPERTASSTSVVGNVAEQGIPASTVQMRLKKMPTCPQKVLDAPGFIDDFYLNLVTWSSSNVLAIALGDSVYCWNAETGNVVQLASCSSTVCSIRWSNDGFYLSIGLEDGSIEVWDFESCQKLRTMRGHDSRVAAQCWNQHVLTTGSRSGQLIQHDVRVQKHQIAELQGHTAEVCGIEWRPDGLQLATGGNDNIVNIWDARSTTPQFTKTAHSAAVKALAWCPTHASLLATGGGSACRKIHFWNTATGARVNTIDTQSQVSSLHWGYSNGVGMELAATHGFPNNDISVYAYPTLQKTGVVIDAHECRVLGSCLSPDRTTLATVAADENLKFWKMFDSIEDSRPENLTEKEINKVIR